MNAVTPSIIEKSNTISKNKNVIVNANFIKYLNQAIPMAYDTGGFAKGLKEVKAKLSKIKVLVTVKNVCDDKYQKLIMGILEGYTGPIYQLEDLDAISVMINKAPFNCGIAGIYHMPKKINMEFEAHLKIHNDLQNN